MSTAVVPLEGDDSRMSLVEHLTELRSRLIKVAIAVVIGMVVSFLLYDPIFDFLLRPYEDIANQGNSATGGRLLQIGTPESLIRSPSEWMVRQFVGPEERALRILSLHRVTIGGRFPMGCVVAEALAILVIAVVALVLYFTGAFGA